jgi:hypothetical protein
MIQTKLQRRKKLKEFFLNYCLDNFENEDIWLIDSLQVFDPYYLSKRNLERTREMLARIKISRPFTIYQLKDKLFGLSKFNLSKKATLLITSLNCFDEDIPYKKEALAIKGIISNLIKNLDCKVVLGVQSG